MNTNEPKKKSIFIYIVEFAIGYLSVLGFLSVAFFDRLPETTNLLIVSLILTTIILGLAEKK
ncbi:MAG: hypothetical protein CEN91_124 [Candidatus Berkelbacteria bacterium Licking1014_85]|uniref:Uncharacterized protein n=1 Tax=Candidatus Berkelbacteria bacterium Licking1014_85 TaxID=2017148 RepID=A0A554LLI7_9BACT|nr:MAG: hypothetical protein CEN91_124 [Candidatus Berkelbacteria bacterium Licking1014_85]